MVNNGIEYEKYCCRYLENMGFTTRTTVISGDQGVDVIAEKDGIKYAVQCKYREDSSVGNDAVQQVAAGRTFYDCDIAIVITNSKFTPSAVKLAEKLRVRLWDSVQIEEDNSEESPEENSDPVGSIEGEVREYLGELKQSIYSFENGNLGQTDYFVSMRVDIKDETIEKSIIEILYKHKIKVGLIKRYSIFQSMIDVYLFELHELDNLQYRIYEASLELAEMNMIIERTARYNIVVGKRKLNSEDDYKLAEINKHKDQLLADKINYVIRKLFSVCAIFLVKGVTEKTRTDAFLFFVENMLSDAQLNSVENELGRIYNRLFKIVKHNDNSIIVYVVNDESFNISEKDSLGTYSNPCGLESDIFASYYSDTSERLVRIQFVLRNINMDDIIDQKTGTPLNDNFYFLWFDICYLVNILFELVSGSVISSITADSIEAYLDIHGIPLFRSRRNCFQLRVLDNKGNVVIIAENTSLLGHFIPTLAFNSFIMGHVDRCLSAGSGPKRVGYTIFDRMPDIIGEDIGLTRFGITKEVNEMEKEMQRLATAIEQKRNIVSELFASFYQNFDNDIRVSIEHIPAKGADILRFTRSKSTFSSTPQRRIDYNPYTGNTLLIQRKTLDATKSLVSNIDKRLTYTFMNISYSEEGGASIISFFMNRDETVFDTYEKLYSNEENDMDELGIIIHKSFKNIMEEIRTAGYQFTKLDISYSSEQSDNDYIMIMVYDGDEMVFDTSEAL